MKILFIMVFVASLIPLVFALEDGWMGIKVFETNREDVEKLPGKPREEEKGDVYYETDKALIHILFSEEPCSSLGTVSGGFNVRKGTVLDYSVVPKEELRVGNLNWDQKLYTRVEDRHQLALQW